MITLRRLQFALLALIGFLCLAVPASAQKIGESEAGVARSWNAGVATITIEDQKWLELSASYQRNPPGRVLLSADVRTAQRKRRLRLIAEIIALEEERIRRLRELAKFEEASQ